MTQPAAWLKDPSGRHELRYWDGVQWTDHVSDQGQTAIDPYDPGAVPPPPSAETTGLSDDMPPTLRDVITGADEYDGCEPLDADGAFWSYVPRTRETPQELDRQYVRFWSASGEELPIEVSVNVVRVKQMPGGPQSFQSQGIGGGLTIGSVGSPSPPRLEEEYVQPGESIAEGLQRAGGQRDSAWIALFSLHWGPTDPDDKPFTRVRCYRVVGTPA